MFHRLDRRLFLENGPTAFAERDRQRRAVGQAYRLLQCHGVTPARPEAPPLSRAA